MATLSFEIKEYKVLLGKDIGVGYANLTYASGTLQCTGTGGETLNIAFARSQALADAASGYTQMANKRGGIVAPMSSFGFYIDILRNEKPVWGQIDDTLPNNLNLLKTGPEPVGEGEPAQTFGLKLAVLYPG